MSNVDTVKEIYAAFGRGDVPAILDKLDDNVEWETETSAQGVPWLEPRRGKANIAGFFHAPAPLQIPRSRKGAKPPPRPRARAPRAYAHQDVRRARTIFIRVQMPPAVAGDAEMA